MELADVFIYFGFYTKVYDSKEEYNSDEHINLLFLDKLPKYDINGRLHLNVLYKMYNDVNFNRPTNVTYYIQTQKYLNKLRDDQVDYNIYIDNFGNFRRIIISVMDKTVHIKNMYF